MDAPEEKNLARALLIDGKGFQASSDILLREYKAFRDLGIPIVPSAIMANYMIHTMRGEGVTNTTKEMMQRRAIGGLYRAVQSRWMIQLLLP